MELDAESAISQVRALVEEYRERCLWHLRPDFYPKNVAEALSVLRAIEAHGDSAGYRRAAALRRWFERNPGGA